MAQNRKMGMFLQDPAFPSLNEDYEFDGSSDFLHGAASTHFEVRDEDLDGVPLYQTWSWEEAKLDLSLNGFQQLADESRAMLGHMPRIGVGPRGKSKRKARRPSENWRALTEIPQFHQVNVFAVADRAIRSVEEELGRPIRWQTGRPLILRPHAFEEANAYFDPDEGAINFGYFRSSFRGGVIWTCLSHDIIVHELGHAILTSLCPQFDWSPEPDVAAFHESFSDLTAIFSALESAKVVDACLQNGGSLQNPNVIASLGEQYGAAMYGLGDPYLRCAINSAKYDPAQPSPHDQSEALTGALYDVLCKMAGKRPPANASNARLRKYAEQVTTEVRHIRGMFLRVVNYLPPTGLTLPQFAQIFIEADRLAFPAETDDGFRQFAIRAFVDHALLLETAAGTGPFSFEPPAKLKSQDLEKAVAGGRFELMTFVNKHRKDFELPDEAVLLDAWSDEANRAIDSETKKGLRKEHYVHYIYEVTLAGAPTMLSGTLVLDETWAAKLWVTDPARQADVPEPLATATKAYEARIIEAYDQERCARALALADHVDELLFEDEAGGDFASGKTPIRHGGKTPIRHGGKTPIRHGRPTPIRHGGPTPIRHAANPLPIRRPRRRGSGVRRVFGIRRR